MFILQGNDLQQQQEGKMILDVSFNLRRIILVFLPNTPDGAAEVAWVMLMGKTFMNLAEDSDVLMTLISTNVMVDGRCLFFHHINGLPALNHQYLVTNMGCRVIWFEPGRTTWAAKLSLPSFNATSEYLLSKGTFLVETQAPVCILNGYLPAPTNTVLNYIKEEAIKQLSCITHVFDGNTHHCHFSYKLFMTAAIRASGALKGLNWSNVRVGGHSHLFQHINGLLRRSAEVGNEAADYMLSKVTLLLGVFAGLDLVVKDVGKQYASSSDQQFETATHQRQRKRCDQQRCHVLAMLSMEVDTMLDL